MSKYATIPPGISPRDELEPVTFTHYRLPPDWMRVFAMLAAAARRAERKRQRRYQHQKRKQ